MTQGIILAAGRGSRLKSLTNFKPKSFNKFKNKRYIDLIIDNFSLNKIKKINIIVGYKSNLFKNYQFNKIFNSKWSSRSIFYSLYCARKILAKNTCIVSYSDIIYNAKALDLLKKNKGKIVLVSNNNWKKVWKKRFKKPLSDLESFQYKKKNNIKYLSEIGAKPKKISSIKGQFAGLFKITPKGWKVMLEYIKKDNVNINNLDITSFFSAFVKKHSDFIQIADYNGMWFEVDTVKDFKILNSKKY